MPLPLAIPLIAGGLSVAGGIASYIQNRNNRKAQEEQNKKDRQWEANRYNLMRANALADRDAENAYNHPLQQMNRLRQAGINPHFYGKGAENTGAAVRNVQSTASKQNAPQNNMDYQRPANNAFSIMMNLMQARQTQATTDNLAKQGNLLVKEGMLKDAQTAKLLQETARSRFDLDQANSLKDIVIKEAKLHNWKLEAEGTRQWNDNTQWGTMIHDEQAKSKISVKQAQANLELTISKIKSEKKLQMLRNEEIKLRSLGLSQNDPIYIRLMSKFAEKLK